MVIFYTTMDTNLVGHKPLDACHDPFIRYNLKVEKSDLLDWKLQILSESAGMWPCDNKSLKCICYRKLNVHGKE